MTPLSAEGSGMFLAVKTVQGVTQRKASVNFWDDWDGWDWDGWDGDGWDGWDGDF